MDGKHWMFIYMMGSGYIRYNIDISSCLSKSESVYVCVCVCDG